MATINRQVGRRAMSNATTAANVASSDSGVPLSPASTPSTATPPRRYVLDVPTGRTRRTSNNRVSDDYDETNTRRSGASDGGAVTYSNVVTTDIGNDSAEQTSQSGSREYYYRDGAFETSGSSSSRYAEDATVRELIESNIGIEDEEVQALTTRASLDVKHYPINVDSNPEMILRPNTQRLTYTQDIAVRYLKPGTPPPPGVRPSLLFTVTQEHALFSSSLSSFEKFGHPLHRLLRRSSFVNVPRRRAHLRPSSFAKSHLHVPNLCLQLSLKVINSCK